MWGREYKANFLTYRINITVTAVHGLLFAMFPASIMNLVRRITPLTKFTRLTKKIIRMGKEILHIYPVYFPLLFETRFQIQLFETKQTMEHMGPLCGMPLRQRRK